ncbi:MAG: DUF2239 family protein [Bryobacteraceae bacterium]
MTYTAFCGHRLIAAGPLAELLPRVKEWVAENGEAGVLYFDDDTGQQVDFNLREPARVGPGRPKLGVTSREVSLLPRHWEWLEQQPNGASAALRRLVEQARNSPGDRERRGREAAGRFMTAMAGNYPGYEEATRALYAGDRERMAATISEWPADVREYAERLAIFQ